MQHSLIIYQRHSVSAHCVQGHHLPMCLVVKQSLFSALTDTFLVHNCYNLDNKCRIAHQSGDCSIKNLSNIILQYQVLDIPIEVDDPSPSLFYGPLP
jgi:hypothetical protein